MGDRFGFEHGPLECIDGADLGLRRTLLDGHCDGDAGNGCVRAPGQLAMLHKLIDQLRVNHGYVERLAGLEPALQLAGAVVVNDDLVTSGAFELRSEFVQGRLERHHAQDLDFRGLRVTLREKQCRRDRGCDNERSHGVLPRCSVTVGARRRH